MPESRFEIPSTNHESQFELAKEHLDISRRELWGAWSNAFSEGMNMPSGQYIADVLEDYQERFGELVRIWSNEYNNLQTVQPNFKLKQLELLLLVGEETQHRRAGEYDIMKSGLRRQRVKHALTYFGGRPRQAQTGQLPSRKQFIHNFDDVNDSWSEAMKSLREEQRSHVAPSLEVMDYGLVRAAEDVTSDLIRRELAVLDGLSA